MRIHLCDTNEARSIESLAQIQFVPHPLVRLATLSGIPKHKILDTAPEWRLAARAGSLATHTLPEYLVDRGVVVVVFRAKATQISRYEQFQIWNHYAVKPSRTKGTHDLSKKLRNGVSVNVLLGVRMVDGVRAAVGHRDALPQVMNDEVPAHGFELAATFATDGDQCDHPSGWELADTLVDREVDIDCVQTCLSATAEVEDGWSGHLGSIVTATAPRTGLSATSSGAPRNGGTLVILGETVTALRCDGFVVLAARRVTR